MDLEDLTSSHQSSNLVSTFLGSSSTRRSLSCGVACLLVEDITFSRPGSKGDYMTAKREEKPIRKQGIFARHRTGATSRTMFNYMISLLLPAYLERQVLLLGD